MTDANGGYWTSADHGLEVYSEDGRVHIYVKSFTVSLGLRVAQDFACAILDAVAYETLVGSEDDQRPD